MSSKYGTAFVESEAMLAATAGDAAEIQRICAGMEHGELLALADAARLVATTAEYETMRSRKP